MRIAFRVDAGLRMGTGHLRRCLTLAAALREAGGSSSFICRNLPAWAADEVQAAGHALIELPPPAERAAPEPGEPAHGHWLSATAPVDAEQTAEAMARAGASGGPWDWIVADHYGIDARWQQQVRPAAARLMVIDDLADRPHQADLLLDQNFRPEGEDPYRSRVPADCHRLLGPRHALLRPEFARLRGAARSRDGRVRRLLVFIGGTDADDMTSVAIAAATQAAPGVPLDVVIGSAHPRRAKIEASCRRAGHRLHVQTPNMGELMLAADLCIGAGGSATWERCTLGLPALALCLADNQRQLLADGARAGFLAAPHIEPGDVQALARHLRCLIESPEWLASLSQRALQVTDGQGAARVVAEMQGLRIEIRPAVADDARAIFEWRNAPQVRGMAHDPRPLVFESHQRWLEGVLADPQRDLLIGHIGGQPVGVVRFDIRDQEALVSIYRVPGQGGPGLGGPLLAAAERWLQARRPAVRGILAEVVDANEASHRLFLRSGYQGRNHHYRKDLHDA